VTYQCRTCGHLSTRRGPCGLCRVYGAPWEATDRVDIVAHGTEAELRREIARERRKCAHLATALQLALKEQDRLHAMEVRVGEWARRSERWEERSRQTREWVRGG
jgi:hypothetical protein